MLQALLAEHEWVLADGATGTVFMDRGLGPGEAPELWNETQPERVLERHRQFVDAGAQLILTNSFGSNRYRLQLHGQAANTIALNEASARLACAVTADCTESIVIAGSMGPTGELLAPVGELAFDDAVRAYVEQAEGLLAGGAHVLWGETLSSREEAMAVAVAATEVAAPYCLTMSFDTAGRTMMGFTPGEFIDMCMEFSMLPLAIGANCGTGASDLLAALLRIREHGVALPVIAKANAGIPQLIDGKIQYDGTPELMARFACLARDAGAQIIGGCCGTAPEHTKAMQVALMSSERGASPSLAEVIASTGELVQVEGMAGTKRKKRRRKTTSIMC